MAVEFKLIESHHLQGACINQDFMPIINNSYPSSASNNAEVPGRSVNSTCMHKQKTNIFVDLIEQNFKVEGWGGGGSGIGEGKEDGWSFPL